MLVNLSSVNLPSFLFWFKDYDSIGTKRRKTKKEGTPIRVLFTLLSCRCWVARKKKDGEREDPDISHENKTNTHYSRGINERTVKAVSEREAAKEKQAGD